MFKGTLALFISLVHTVSERVTKFTLKDSQCANSSVFAQECEYVVEIMYFAPFKVPYC